MTAPTKSERDEDDYAQRQFQWEDDHMGNFRRIYPCSGEDKYQPYFTQNALSVFQDTVASRAREVASRIEREENEVYTHINIFLLLVIWRLRHRIRSSYSIDPKWKIRARHSTFLKSAWISFYTILSLSS